MNKKDDEREEEDDYILLARLFSGLRPEYIREVARQIIEEENRKEREEKPGEKT